MSIYHRRVYLRAKKSSLIRPQLQPSTQQTQSSQSTPSLSNVLPLVPAYQATPKTSSFNCLTEKLYHLANNQVYSIVMSVITIYTIFAIDIDKAFFNVDASTYFSLAHCVAIFLFVLEILLLSITKQGYPFKFYFWIDCFSTLTMILELIWVQNLMSTSSDVTVALSFAKVTKASRLSKIGARSSKIMKLIRLVKLIKLFNKEEEKLPDLIKQKEYDQNGKTLRKETSKTQRKENSSKQAEEQEEQTNNNINQKNCEVVEEQSEVSSQSSSSDSNKEAEPKQMEYIKEQQPSQHIIDKKYTFNRTSSRHHHHESPEQNFQQTPFPQQNQILQYPSFHNITNESPKFLAQSHPNNLSHQLSIPEETFQPYSFSHDSHQMISEEDKNNIEDIMKLFFTQNMNRFVEEGKLISTKNCHTKKDSNNFYDIGFTHSNQHSQRQNPIASIGSDGNQNSSTKRPRTSGRLSFVKRKQLIDLSRMRDNHKQKASRFNKNYVVQAPFSNIVQRLQKSLHLPPISRPNVDKQKQQEIQRRYQELVEKQRQQKDPKKVLTSQNLKVGEVLKQEIQKNIVIMVMGLIMVLPIIAADTWFDSDAMLNTTANLFIEDIYLLPNGTAKTKLMQTFIQTGLEMTNPLQFFRIPINQTCCQFPKDFPAYTKLSDIKLSDLRMSQQTIVIDDNITIIYSKKQSSQFTAYLNLGRSLFITILLIFCSILFMKDIENYALNPLEKMSTLINKISNNPFQALKQINEEKNNRNSTASMEDEENGKLILHKVDDIEDQKLQTNILSNAIIKITSLLTIGAGQIGSQIISKNIQNLNQQKSPTSSDLNQTMTNSKNQLKSIGQSQIAVYVYVQLRHFQKICDIFGDQIFKYINKVADIVHQDTIELGGIPIQYDGNGFLLLWKPNTEILSHFDEPLSQQQNQTLAKLTILAIHSLTKIFLDINALEESKRFYQYMSQKYSSEQQNSPKVMFRQNYQPHILNASIHVGESFYGSMGSQFKLECKCIGYDVAYTRFLGNFMEQQGYGVGVVVSEDIYLLFEEYQNISKRLKLRKIDQLRIKQFRFKDKSLNSNLTYMNTKQLQNIKSSKTTKTSIYTFDFAGKLESFNSNQSQMMNIESPATGFMLAKTHQLSQYSHNVEKSVNHNEKGSKASSRNLNSFNDLYEEKNKKTLLAYQERERWLGMIERDGLNQLVTKLQIEYRAIKQARQCFESQFYQNWSDALECYYAREFTEAMNEFRFLHTYNQPYNDSPAKVFINRLENINMQEIELEHMNTEEDESESSEESSEEQMSRREMKKKRWNGMYQVVWKL